MAEAPEQVVRRVQEALGCESVFGPDGAECGEHRFWSERGCDAAVEAADAAFTASLEWAANEADQRSRIYGIWLRRLAGTETE